MEWTDEKHFSYLKSLEATFVEELNHSMQLCHWGSHKNTWRAHPKQRFTTDTRYSSEQVWQGSVNFVYFSNTILSHYSLVGSFFYDLVCGSARWLLEEDEI